MSPYLDATDRKLLNLLQSSFPLTPAPFASIAETLGFPCVLKKPDSAFSLGVTKVNTQEELCEQIKRLLAERIRLNRRRRRRATAK